MKLIILLLAIIAFSFATEFGIYFQGADLNFAQQVDDWNLKGILGVQELQRVAKASQSELIALLDLAKVQYSSYYVANMIIVEDIKPELLARIAKMPGIVKIEKLEPPKIEEPKVEELKSTRFKVEWNVEMVRAPEAWARGFNGTGIIVANLDTGINFTHPDLLPSYRGNNGGSYDHNYNWFDGTTQKTCRNVPCDQNGHGTHVMGTMVGTSPTLKVGVAPGAKWVACRSFATGSASNQEIMNCFQWFLNPTDTTGNYPDPTKRPHIINHSWGSSQPNTGYRDAIENLHRLGSLNFISAGNSGPRCSSMGWPGGFNASFTSGALGTNTTVIASFSSRGPLPSGYSYLKPDVATPGQNINSCSHTGGYRTLSGTSMSSPCTTGSAAVILSAKPALIGNMERLKELIFKTCKPIRSRDCTSSQDHPNNVYGWGLVDIVAAIEA